MLVANGEVGSGVRNGKTSQFMSSRNSDEHDVEGKLRQKKSIFLKVDGMESDGVLGSSCKKISRMSLAQASPSATSPSQEK